MKLLYFSICLLLAAPCAAQSYLSLMAMGEERGSPADLRFEDAVYDPTIRTPWLFPVASGEEQRVQWPAMPLEAQQEGENFLRLIFDDLSSEGHDFMAKLIHCNADWKPSSLPSIEYLDSYNEFRINTFEPSVNTKVPYIHYIFDVPAVKASGNYLLLVYKNGREEQRVLSRRMVVYESGSRLRVWRQPLAGVEEAMRQQQLGVKANYANLRINNPNTDVTVVLRQNGRWDNALLLNQPIFNDGQELSYSSADLATAFKGGNEFRTIDASSLLSGGMGVRRTVSSDTINQLLLYAEKPRTGMVYYSGMQDMGGRFNIAIRERNAPDWEADYAEVAFQLQTGNALAGNVYVVGGFTDWQLREEARLSFVPSAGTYMGVLLLKQGFYDYMYAEEGADANSLEGNHSQTRNEYDAIMYYKPIGARGDRAIGYAYLPY